LGQIKINLSFILAFTGYVSSFDNPCGNEKPLLHWHTVIDLIISVFGEMYKREIT
jgi:hypothetical protein